MKTINEAAQEYAEKKLQEKAVCKEILHTAFVDGVNYAQRWIPVEEELPKFLENVLAKDSKGNIYIGFYGNSSGWNLNNYHSKMVITHWQLVEYK